MRKEDRKRREKLQNWLLDFIDESREGYSLLPLSEQATRFYLDCQAPCQIEVFWLEEPEYQIIYINRDTSREDKDIIINGPYAEDFFLDEVEKVLREPRWTKVIPESTHFKDLGVFKDLADMTYAEAFELGLSFFSREIKESFLDRKRDEFGHFRSMSSLVPSRGTLLLRRGDLTALDSKDEAEHFLKVSTYKPSAREIAEEKTALGRLVDSYGSSFYPPIWVGSKLKKSFRLRIIGKDGTIIPRKVCPDALSFLGAQVMVYSDGFVGVITQDKVLALRILNTIFGVASALGIECSPVTELELVKVSVDRVSLDINFWSLLHRVVKIPHWSPRASVLLAPGQSEEYYNRKAIASKRIKEIVTKAERLSKDSELTEQLLFWNAGRNHYISGEYGQSFVMNWMVIEKNIHNMLDDLRSQNKSLNNYLEKLQERGPLDHILALLEVGGIVVNNIQYSELNELRLKRNDFIHSKKEIDQKWYEQWSKKCLKIATQFIRNSLSNT